jgi:hypothetical protein
LIASRAVTRHPHCVILHKIPRYAKKIEATLVLYRKEMQNQVSGSNPAPPVKRNGAAG